MTKPRPKTAPGIVGINVKRLPTNGQVVIAKSATLIPESIIINGTPAPEVQNANEILRQAAITIGDRAAQRDNTGGAGERSMAATVTAFNAIEGTALTERQGWAFMGALKMVRAATSARNGKHDADSHLDGAAYAALAGEAASREECTRVQEAWAKP